MRAATFDSSFWVHAVYLELVEFLLADFALMCPKAVENELGAITRRAADSKNLLADKSIKRAAARSEKIKLYGRWGEGRDESRFGAKVSTAY